MRSDPIDEVDRPEQEDEGDDGDRDRQGVGDRRATAAESARDQGEPEHITRMPRRYARGIKVVRARIKIV